MRRCGCEYGVGVGFGVGMFQNLHIMPCMSCMFCTLCFVVSEGLGQMAKPAEEQRKRGNRSRLRSSSSSSSSSSSPTEGMRPRAPRPRVQSRALMLRCDFKNRRNNNCSSYWTGLVLRIDEGKRREEAFLSAEEIWCNILLFVICHLLFVVPWYTGMPHESVSRNYT